MDAIQNPFCTRDDVVLWYGAAIHYGDEVDWPKVNAAIIERWNKSALVYVKRKAWKYVERRKQEGW